MLRRLESSWRKEYVLRYNLRRRWERSHNSTITHTPHHSAVSGMLLMPEVGLLTSSVQYGIVSRSLPLTGKILRGFLDASGTGLGIGNPNAEFTPNVSVCALSSDGGTAKIVWAFRNGEVAVMTAARAMDNGRAAAKLTRCKLEDQHDGVVQDVAWCGINAFITGASDGKVKLWDSRRVSCIWTSTRQDGTLIADPCVKVTGSCSKGIVGVMQSGNISVWTGLQGMLSDDGPQVPLPVISEINIPLAQAIGNPRFPSTAAKVTALHIDPASSSSHLILLAAYAEHFPFHKLHVDLQTKNVSTTPFGEESHGHLTVVKPCFGDKTGEASFIIAGDQLGGVSIYNWNAPRPSLGDVARDIPAVPALRNFEGHEDGAVTQIAWNSVTLVTGSARGTVKVWDSFTFIPLRTFPSPAARPSVGGEWDGVSQIVLEKDLLVVSVGSRVMAWRAGPVSHRGQPLKKGKHPKKSKSHALAKGYKQLELHKDIAESKKELEHEQTHVKRAYGREKEQRSTLDNLGLDEVEAIEYVLMLSRDEEEARRPSPPASADEGVFETDFDDVSPRRTNFGASASKSIHSSPNSIRSIPRTSPSTSNRKVQMSPHFRPESLEASVSISPLTVGPVAAVGSPPIEARSLSVSSIGSDHFPPISPPLSNPSTPSNSVVHRSLSSSPETSRTAWSNNRRYTPPSSSPPSPQISTDLTAGTGRSASNALGGPSMSPGSSLFSADLARHVESRGSVALAADPADDMDEDLRYAIELSLAEALSRGMHL
ncbi:hypothetical protein FIBSPDRAFT_780494 [Athelia psychrophila]|uniref:Uncharacterized protein n=1 Tax=Athelia psychrophila TaxID=1759441 RepID=A0A166R779_9AGAM|nr:hypothetical protein FIBSPDRAFT_780494 [Fibularhizoctonia sp. CBS 109695]